MHAFYVGRCLLNRLGRQPESKGHDKNCMENRVSSVPLTLSNDNLKS